MGNKYLFKSDINIAISILFCILVYFIFKFIWVFGENNIYKYLIFILSPLLFYFSLYWWANRCYFYDEWLEIKYFFRFKRRIIKFNYEEVSNIRYLCTDSGFIQPTLTIKILKNELTKKNKSFSFPLRSYSKRRDILRFLASKGLSIEIQSVHEKDQDILS